MVIIHKPFLESVTVYDDSMLMGMSDYPNTFINWTSSVQIRSYNRHSTIIIIIIIIIHIRPPGGGRFQVAAKCVVK